MEITVNILGWIGSILLVAAYWLNSNNKMTAQDWTYQLMNVIGGLFLIVNTAYYGAYPSTAVNVIWFFIGMAYLVPQLKKVDSNTEQKERKQE